MAEFAGAAASDAMARLLAFYLPQFHPIPENDAWWEPGFTEWTNVRRARPLFPGHYQPHEPGELGYYDLREPEVRAAQAELARTHGIHGFCYYHYWFGGRRILERPFDEVRASGEPDFPFCLCWANEPWTRAWDGRTGTVLLEQRYSPDDDSAHIRWLLEAFADPRYVRIDGKPLFLVYRAGSLPDCRATTDLWREEAQRAGVGELHLCCVESFASERGLDPRPRGFDAAVDFQPDWSTLGAPQRRGALWSLLRLLRLSHPAWGRHRIYSYADVVERWMRRPAPSYPRYPGVTPGFDNSPRRQRDAVVLQDSDPEIFRRWLETALAEARSSFAEPFVFVNAWNEWAEGNHLEPCARFGRAFLEGTRQTLAHRLG